MESKIQKVNIELAEAPGKIHTERYQQKNNICETKELLSNIYRNNSVKEGCIALIIPQICIEFY